MTQVVRKPVNLSLDPGLMAEVRALGVNASRAAEVGLRAAVAAARAEVWQRENAEALASSNNWVEANGLPLAPHRPF